MYCKEVWHFTTFMEGQSANDLSDIIFTKIKEININKIKTLSEILIQSKWMGTFWISSKNVTSIINSMLCTANEDEPTVFYV